MLLQLLKFVGTTSITIMLSLAEFKPSAGRIFVKPPPAANFRLSRI